MKKPKKNKQPVVKKKNSKLKIPRGYSRFYMSDEDVTITPPPNNNKK